MDRNKIKEASKVGLKGILDIYLSDKKVLWRGFLYPMILTIALFIILIFNIKDTEIFELLEKINNISIGLLPSLLGFNLGAYTLFIAFGGSDFVKKIVGFKEDKKSIYQKNSSIFAISILLQIFSLLFAYALSQLLSSELIATSYFLFMATNYVVLFMQLLLNVASIYILFDIVINIFNLSQMYHFTAWREKEEDDRKNDS